jgi:hypothetical protein
MSRLLLAPFVIVGLLLLPSCSTSENSAVDCKSVLSGYDKWGKGIFIKGKEMMATGDMVRKLELAENIKEDSKVYYTLIVEYPTCFEPDRVIYAKLQLEEYKKTE